MGRRGRGGETSDWLQLWCRRLGMAGGVLGASASAALLVAVNVDVPTTGWLLPAMGFLFGMAIPLALTGFAVSAVGVGMRLRGRPVSRWWFWPGLSVGGWAIYALQPSLVLRM